MGSDLGSSKTIEDLSSLQFHQHKERGGKLEVARVYRFKEVTRAVPSVRRRVGVKNAGQAIMIARGQYVGRDKETGACIFNVFQVFSGRESVWTLSVPLFLCGGIDVEVDAEE